MRNWMMTFVLAGSLLPGVLRGQESEASNAGPYSLQEAVAFATKNYPAIRASLAEVSAADNGIGLARTAYLPKTDLLLHFNRATRNNVFGLVFPTGVLPAISGPALEDSTYTSTFGSAAGLLFSWESFDFGLRAANVRVAEALKARAEAGRQVTAYEVSLAVADAYLRAVGNRLAVDAANATVERMQVFADSVGVLVENELRPGADESRAQAELAQARTELIRAEQQAQEALAGLAEWMGLAGRPVRIEPGALLGDPPGQAPSAAPLERHPIAQAQEAEIGVVEARREALAKEYRPKLELLGAVYGRGTGARLDGTFRGGAHGLAPSTGNWAVGFNLRFNVFDYYENRSRRRIEADHEETERAKKERVLQELKGQIARAQIAVESARRVAENTPLELQAARTLETQAETRYQIGLGTVVEVAEAQRLLRKAEANDALARLEIWRALFTLAAVQGEMEELLDLSSR